MKYGICKKAGRNCEVGRMYAVISGGNLCDAYEAKKVRGRIYIKFVCVGRFGRGELDEYFGELCDVA